MKFRFQAETPLGMLIVYLNNIYLLFDYLTEQRKQEAEKIRLKYPERIPVMKPKPNLEIFITIIKKN